MLNSHFFGEITRHQFPAFAASLEINGPVAVGKRKPDAGTAKSGFFH